MKVSEKILDSRVWLTKREASLYSGVSQRYFDASIRPHIRTYRPNSGITAKVLFRRDEIDEYLRSCCETPELVVAL